MSMTKETKGGADKQSRTLNEAGTHWIAEPTRLLQEFVMRAATASQADKYFTVEVPAQPPPTLATGETPRTDANVGQGEIYGGSVPANFARQLERELAEANAARATLHDTCREYEARLSSTAAPVGWVDERAPDELKEGGQPFAHIYPKPQYAKSIPLYAAPQSDKVMIIKMSMAPMSDEGTKGG